jgi:capsular exopolysaccharide synthesis family protein
MRAETFDDESRVVDLRDYGRALWRRRAIVVSSVIAVVAVAMALSLAQTRTYKATTALIIQPSGAEQLISGGNQSPQDAARQVATETAVLQSNVIKGAAAQLLGHVPNVSVSGDSSTSNVITVTAQSTNKARAARDANGYANAYVSFRRSQSTNQLLDAASQVQRKLNDVSAQLTRLPAGSAALATAQTQQSVLKQQLNQIQAAENVDQVGGARVLSVAVTPTTPASPKPLRNAAIAIVLGLLLGVGLAFLREYLDDKIRSREDLEEATDGLPVLAEIPVVKPWSKKKTNPLLHLDPSKSEEPASEAFRTLRTSIQFLGVTRPVRTIQITSAESAEGKTVTVANLAVAVALSGFRVAVVCCDLRRPRLHELFGLRNEIGFTSVLLGDASIHDALQSVEWTPNLAVLAAGPAAPNPSELLATRRARRVLSEIADEADVVLLDSPPVLPVSDALVVSGMSDATVLVATAASSRRQAIRRALEILAQIDAPVVGTILNKAAAASTYRYSTYATATASNGSNGSRSRHANRAKRVRTNS